jgi:amidase
MGRPVDDTTLGPSVLAAYRHGLALSAAQLLDALAVYDGVTRQVGRFMAGYDLLVTPTSTILPEPIGTFDPDRAGIDLDGVFDDLAPKETFTALFNATGQPAVSLPLGRSASGLPIGVQFVARFGREDLLLAVARQLEDELQGGRGIWGQGLPPVHAGNLEGV